MSTRYWRDSSVKELRNILSPAIDSTRAAPLQGGEGGREGGREEGGKEGEGEGEKGLQSL